MNSFEDKEGLQLCIAMSSKIDGKSVVARMKETQKWRNIQQAEIKDVEKLSKIGLPRHPGEHDRGMP